MQSLCRFKNSAALSIFVMEVNNLERLHLGRFVAQILRICINNRPTFCMKKGDTFLVSFVVMVKASMIRCDHGDKVETRVVHVLLSLSLFSFHGLQKVLESNIRSYRVTLPS